MLNVGKFYRRSHRRLATQITGLASLVAIVLAGLPAQASVTLTRAEVEALRNRVEFIPRGRQARAARMSDFLALGDALRTAASSQADLRFNDGSLARVGERATFRFVPNTRNFRLTNGTVLLLIPPGQGRTNIQTPSAVTGIQGSAVVVRYVPESDLTLVMALTNNPAGPMTITTSSCGEGVADCSATEYALYGGQMALIQNNQVQVVEFDLPTFYQTSPLVEGLELDNPNAESPLGPALEAVREETLEALSEQVPFSESITLNPALIGIDSNGQIITDQNLLPSPATAGVSPTPSQFPTEVVNTPAPDPSLNQPPIAGGGDFGNNGGSIGIGVGGGGIGVGVGVDPRGNNGNNGVGVGVGGDPGNNNAGGNGNGNGVGNGNNGVGVGVGGDPGNGNGNGGNGNGGNGNNGVGVGVGGDPGNNNAGGNGNGNGVGNGSENGGGNGVGNGGGVGGGGSQPDDPFIPPVK
ncbi:FecR family protein [Nodosilinea sp. FACHB-13]|uniref:FecR family protein n=1 Tax=Cyanophyceae TaxID=3028117 RepID=UPI00168634CF|nr:FecR family protein [Nodosilinea sp. FACHB-13]MBD2109481.1 FecR domain-containing protein [Nodosilinea sp. FACHB-13]